MDEWRSLYNKGLQKWDAGASQEAEALFREAAERGGPAIVWITLGRELISQQRWEDAENALSRAIQLDPDSALGYCVLGLAYLKQRKCEHAVKALGRSVALEVRPSTLVLMGTGFRMLGMDDDAKECFERALEIDPRYEEAYLHLGDMVQKRDREAAIKHFRTAVEIDPNYARAHAELGIALGYSQMSLVHAEHHCRRAVELDEANPWYRLYLADVLALMGVADGAEEAYRHAILLEPQNSFFHRKLARFYKQQGRFVDAEQYYQRAIGNDPTEASSYLEYALFLRDLDRTDQARACLLEGAKILPESVELSEALKEYEY